ncbi:hypothetical protein A3B45_04420 [Candidatus Daviesbacteria bacterium RIFCSPLOWO2_01_FULL_39_12]|uniref:Methyltransferase type 11 domain-containing protein n=1 Tax=Candidatus Daviesbacteria bacterium RIFCSPLOWO2_01_FULL_39_12 TaxID=1797785 RepID=A0A1F5KN20_9BACT|nr:MAG: hypothetical protein A3B45_04420 [Candidatus Daviesbacteria bacterium RIFCSPLOWO2_01_FULL_39_12]
MFLIESQVYHNYYDILLKIMLNTVTKHNIKTFTERIEQYKTYELTIGEKYLIKKYFDKSGGKILVLGCGAGRTLIPLQKMGYQVTGIDMTPKMVKVAQEKVKGLPVKVLEMDACQLDFPKNSFDIIFFPANGMSCIYPDIFKCISEAQRVMQPQGLFVFSTHSRFNLKALPRFFEGPYANYKGFILYRSTPLDWLKLKKYFQKIKIIPYSSIECPWKKADWKDVIHKLLPFFDRATYYICIGKK